VQATQAQSVLHDSPASSTPLDGGSVEVGELVAVGRRAGEDRGEVV